MNGRDGSPNPSSIFNLAINILHAFYNSWQNGTPYEYTRISKMLIGWVHIHIFMLCLTNFFPNQIKINLKRNLSRKHAYMNIHPKSFLVTPLEGIVRQSVT